VLALSRKLLTKFFRCGVRTNLGLLGAAAFFKLSHFLWVATFCVLNIATLRKRKPDNMSVFFSAQ
jgi:hypothetical protein